MVFDMLSRNTFNMKQQTRAVGQTFLSDRSNNKKVVGQTFLSDLKKERTRMSVLPAVQREQELTPISLAL